tara:strand:+ start:1378 stop:1575 length:198 start_codon:yes stop_codon:yes gene_type:complete
MVYHTHDEMEVVLGLFICHEIVEGGAFKVDPGALLGKDPLDAHEHLKDILRSHATIIVIIAELKQ